MDPTVSTSTAPNQGGSDNPRKHGKHGKPPGGYKRTRSGCRVCRKRKMKCDEEKPVCGNCRKSGRELQCNYGDVVSWRHQQNAAVDDPSQRQLPKFYKDRTKFTAEQAAQMNRMNYEQVQFVSAYTPGHGDPSTAVRPAPSSRPSSSHANANVSLNNMTAYPPIDPHNLSALANAAADQYTPATNADFAQNNPRANQANTVLELSTANQSAIDPNLEVAPGEDHGEAQGEGGSGSGSMLEGIEQHADAAKTLQKFTEGAQEHG